MEKIGILTGGGDAPGLNAAIRSATTRAIRGGYEVIGFNLGWAGVLTKDWQPLTLAEVEDIHRVGGTILGASRTNPGKVVNGYEITKQNLKDLEISALITIGGDDTLGAAFELSKRGVDVVGVPKTIDNDLSGTDYTFGFDTAANIVMEAIDDLHATVKAHRRVMVVEIMGRNAGWITLHGGLAGGAHIILPPEEKIDLSRVYQLVNWRYEQGKSYAIIAVAEGATSPELEELMKGEVQEIDEFGNVIFAKRKRSVAEVLADEIEKATGKETRHVVLGHLQRGGHPSALDRVLATRLGIKAVEMVKNKEFGQMAALRGDEITSVPLSEAVEELKTVPQSRIEELKLLLG